MTSQLSAEEWAIVHQAKSTWKEPGLSKCLELGSCTRKAYYSIASELTCGHSLAPQSCAIHYLAHFKSHRSVSGYYPRQVLQQAEAES